MGKLRKKINRKKRKNSLRYRLARMKKPRAIVIGGSKQEARPGYSFGLNGGKSKGGGLKYSWEQVGGKSIELSDTDSKNLSFVVPYTTDTLRFKFIAFNKRGKSQKIIKVKVLPEKVKRSKKRSYKLRGRTSKSAGKRGHRHSYKLNKNGSGWLNTHKKKWQKKGHRHRVIGGVVRSARDSKRRKHTHKLQRVPRPPKDTSTRFGKNTPIMEMIDTLHSLGYKNISDLDVSKPQGVIDISDGEFIKKKSGDARPLEFIKKAMKTGRTNLIELFFPVSGEFKPSDTIAPAWKTASDYKSKPLKIAKKINSREKREKLTKIKITTVDYFSDNVSPTLRGSDVYTSSVHPSNHPYYFGVTDGDPEKGTSDTQCYVSFGHYKGSGSLTGGTGYNFTKGSAESVYKQYASFLLDSSLGVTDDTVGGFYISSGSDNQSTPTVPNKDKWIYVLNFKRSLFKDQLQEGTWTLTLSGSHDGNPKTINLTDNSVRDKSYVDTVAGRRYNIFEGSAGKLSGQTLDNRYGYFYPDVGIMVFGEKLSNEFITSANPGVGAFNSVGNDQNQLYPRLSTNSADKNALRFINCMRNVDGNCLTLYGERESTSVTYACRFKALEYNYTTNLSIISSSGENIKGKEAGRMNGFIISSSYTGKDGTEYIKGTSTMDGNPHSFITGVQLYNKSGIAVAVASLSKPLLKNFTKEGVIKVRLDL